MKPVLVYLDLDGGRWARYEGKNRTLRGVTLGAQNGEARRLDWGETLRTIRDLPHTLTPEAA